MLGEEKIEALLLEDVRTKERRNLPVKGLFLAIGHSPATKFLQGTNVELDEKGYVTLGLPNNLACMTLLARSESRRMIMCTWLANLSK